MTNNYTGYAERAIVTAESINYNIGEIVKIGIHFTSGDAILAISDVGSYSGYGTYITVFKCDNISGHQVDYTKLDENEEEYNEEYAAECAKYGISDGCNSESEIIVENRKFRVLNIITENGYGEPDECGDLGIRIIKVEMI